MGGEWVSILIVCLCKGIASARITNFEVPAFALKGESVFLNCEYDLEGAGLYALRWYKDYQEFYRFYPFDNPTIRTFPLQGVHVDKADSSAGRIVLENLSFWSSGKYACEVSGRAPTFQTFVQEKNLTVLDPPDSPPVITGLKNKYITGESVEANCTSPRSYPAVTITWYINSESASPLYLTQVDKTLEVDGAVTTTQGLNFTIQETHWNQDHSSRGSFILLKCVSFIPGIYWESAREIIRQLNHVIVDDDDTHPPTTTQRTLEYSHPITTTSTTIKDSHPITTTSTTIKEYNCDESGQCVRGNYGDTATWNESISKCEAAGERLAVIANQSMNNLVNSVYNRNVSAPWIGISGNSSESMTWIDGFSPQDYGYHNWTNVVGFDSTVCGLINEEGWTHTYCSDRRYYICQKMP